MSNSSETPVELDVQIEKLSLQKNDLVIVYIPPNGTFEDLAALRYALAAALESYSKELNINCLMLREGTKIDVVPEKDMNMAGWYRPFVKEEQNKEIQEIEKT